MASLVESLVSVLKSPGRLAVGAALLGLGGLFLSDAVRPAADFVRGEVLGQTNADPDALDGAKDLDSILRSARDLKSLLGSQGVAAELCGTLDKLDREIAAIDDAIAALTGSDGDPNAKARLVRAKELTLGERRRAVLAHADHLVVGAERRAALGSVARRMDELLAHCREVAVPSRSNMTFSGAAGGTPTADQ